MSTDVPNEAKQAWIKPSIERWFNLYSTAPQCIEIDDFGEFLSKAFLECIAELRLNTAEPLGSRGFHELAPTAPPCPRLSEDRIVAPATTTTSTSSTTS